MNKRNIKDCCFGISINYIAENKRLPSLSWREIYDLSVMDNYFDQIMYIYKLGIYKISIWSISESLGTFFKKNNNFTGIVKFRVQETGHAIAVVNGKIEKDIDEKEKYMTLSFLKLKRNISLITIENI